jgi:hypothetical protein
MDEDTSNDSMLMMYVMKWYVGLCKTHQFYIWENTIDYGQISICYCNGGSHILQLNELE